MREIGLVFARDLRAHLRGFLFWVVPVAILLGIVIWIQPSMARHDSALEAKLAMLPESLKQLFGVGALDFTRPAGYLAVNFLTVTLCASLSAGMLGATLVAKEEAMHTAELLLTLPVARSRVLLGKAGVLMLHVIGFHLVLVAVALGGLAMVVKGSVEAGRVVSMFGGTAVLGVCFGGLGMLVATVVQRPRAAANAGLGVVLGAYLISVVGAISPKLEWFGQLSPFRAVAPTKILAEGGLDPVAVVALLAVGIGGAAAAIVRYERRDIMV